jgi:hypothetical protein
MSRIDAEGREMAQPQVIQGTLQEIQDCLKGLNGNMRLTLIVPAEEEQEEPPKNFHHATPEERARALDEIAEMNRDLPILPPEAYNRESLYEESS